LGAEDAEIVGFGTGPGDQRGLPDPRVAEQDEGAAAAAPRRSELLRQALLLVPTADEHAPIVGPCARNREIPDAIAGPRSYCR
jgi:hypothetical protein